MLTKCANPACFARFHYFHEGKLFTIEPTVDRPQKDLYDPEYATGRHAAEYFWLCSECCRALTIESSGVEGVPVVRQKRMRSKTIVMEDRTHKSLCERPSEGVL